MGTYVHVNGEPIDIGFAQIQKIIDVCSEHKLDNFEDRMEALVRNQSQNQFGDPTQVNYTWSGHKNVRFCHLRKGELMSKEKWGPLPSMEDIQSIACTTRTMHFEVD